MNDLIGKKVLGRTPEKDEQPNILQDYANTSSAGSIIAFSQYSKDMNKDEIGVLCSFLVLDIQPEALSLEKLKSSHFLDYLMNNVFIIKIIIMALYYG